MPGRPAPLLDRFLAKIMPEPNSGCWLWTGACNSSGYGHLLGEGGATGEIIYAHRFSFEHFNRPLLLGENACHRCDVRPCVNPDHLFAGSDADNMQDAARKGRLVTYRDRQSRISRAMALAIFAAAQSGLSHRVIGERFGISRPGVGRVLRGEIKNYAPD